MIDLLYITAHLGGGAGKAISGITKNTSYKCKNTIVLLEKPVEEKYSQVCKACGADLITEPSYEEIIKLAEDADAVIFNWWAHPLTVDLIRKLGKAKTRLVLWSHINGLQYPVLTSDFLLQFEGLLFTSPCSAKNSCFSESDKNLILQKSASVYGTGDFRPVNNSFKTDYETGKEIRIGYIGTLDFAKLNSDFPRICFEIKRRVPKVRFVLCGKYSEDFINNFFSEYSDLNGCIEFTGYINDPEKYLLSFDIFCYPLSENNYATTENALLEAMAAGLPVIVLDNPPEREIVENDITGSVASDVNDFIEKCIILCGDADKRKILGMSARRSVIDKYDADVNADSFITAVENSLSSDKRGHDFDKLIGSDIFENFLYFTGEDKEKILRLFAGADVHLPEIYYSFSKSSPMHYTDYFRNDKFEKLCRLLHPKKFIGSEDGK